MSFGFAVVDIIAVGKLAWDRSQSRLFYRSPRYATGVPNVGRRAEDTTRIDEDV